MLPAHFSGRSALEVEDTGNGFAVKQWDPFPRCLTAAPGTTPSPLGTVARRGSRPGALTCVQPVVPVRQPERFTG